MKTRSKPAKIKKAKGLLEKAVKFHREKNYEAAQRHYRTLLEQGNFDAKVSNLMGVLMFQTGRPGDSRDFFERSLKIEPKDVETYNNYSSTLEMLGDGEGALSVCRRGLSQTGGANELRRRLFGYLVRAKQYDEAIECGEKLLAENAHDLSVAANLNAAYFFNKDTEKALYWGEKFLIARDAQVTGSGGFAAESARTANVEPAAFEGKEQIISYSLWGSNKFYTDGAIRNAELAAEIYPEWKSRFYCASSVSEDVTRSLKSLGCQVVLMKDEEGFGGTFWRFLVADDPSVGRFMIRDADSRINGREKAAVTEWISSGRPFHVMRDAVVHCDLMLAGLWGGCSGFLPGMSAMLEGYTERSPKFADQNFLAKKVWPLIKNHVLIHDSYYRCFDSRPFPENTELEGQHHVGAGVAAGADPPRSNS